MELDTQALDRLTADCKTPGDVEKIYSKMLQHIMERKWDASLYEGARASDHTVYATITG